MTENTFGAGRAHYIASAAEDRFLADFYGHLLSLRGIAPLLEVPAGVEVTQRETDQRRLLFVLNHTPNNASVKLAPGIHFGDHLIATTTVETLTLPGHGVAIIAAREDRIRACPSPLVVSSRWCVSAAGVPVNSTVSSSSTCKAVSAC